MNDTIDRTELRAFVESANAAGVGGAVTAEQIATMDRMKLLCLLSYLALCDPPTVRGLLRYIEALESAVREAIRGVESIYDTPLGTSAAWRALLEEGPTR